MCKMHKKNMKYCQLYKKCTLNDGKTGKNVDRYGKGCYPKFKLRAAKKESLQQETQMFLQKAFIFWNIS